MSKTTLAGILGGFLIMFGPQMGARLQGDKTVPPVNLSNVIGGMFAVTIGKLAKDQNEGR